VILYPGRPDPSVQLMTDHDSTCSKGALHAMQSQLLFLQQDYLRIGNDIEYI
jgi:hypothetical protein